MAKKHKWQTDRVSRFASSAVEGFFSYHLFPPIITCFTAAGFVSVVCDVRVHDPLNYALSAMAIGATVCVWIATLKHSREAAGNHAGEPGALGEILLCIVLPTAKQEEVLGDLKEYYARRKKHLGKWAILPYWSQVLQLLWPYLMGGIRRLISLGLFRLLGHWWGEASQFLHRR